MRPRDERLDSPAFYEWLAPIYDDLYDAIDVEEAVRQWNILVRKLTRLPRAGHPRPRLLDIGCGTGRYLMEWTAVGFDVTGVDASRSMVTRAKRRAKTGAPGVPVPAVIRGDLRNDVRQLRARGPFDVAVAHFNFLNLFTVEDVSLVLAHLAPSMARGAFLFADCAPPDLAAETSEEALTLPNGQRLTISTSTEIRRGSRAILRGYRHRGSTRSERYHLHSIAELRRAARAAGWRVERVMEWRPERVRAPWAFTRVARNRHRVYALRPSGPSVAPSRSS
jgi:SAM-dependent methyltransferase